MARATPLAGTGVLALFLLTSCKSGSVSGNVSGAVGVVVEITGPERATFTTGRDGGFSFGELNSGRYTLSPWLPGYTCAPSSRVVDVDGDAVGAQDFSAVGLPGTFDVLFGEGGRVLLRPMDSQQETVLAMTVQPDGRPVVVTTSYLPPEVTVRVVRFLDDGTPDPSFGSNGIARVGVPGLLCDGHAVAVGVDGRVVVAGGCYDPAGPRPMLLARLEADGGLDARFGDGGTALTLVRTAGTAYAVGIEGDGAIVVAGAAGDVGAPDEVALARFLPEGRLDPSFGDGGVALAGIPGGAFALGLQTDGKVVVAGSTPDAEGPQRTRTMVARYLGTGLLDAAFGDGGVAIPARFLMPLSPLPYQWAESDAASAVAVQPDGKIVTVGSTVLRVALPNDEGWIALTRWTADGRPDESFGVPPNAPGTVSIGVLYRALGYALALPGDGKILVGSSAMAGFSPGNVATVLRCQANGSLDPSFGTQGEVRGTGSYEEVRALALQADGKIVSAGSSNGTALLLQRMWP